MRWGEEWAELSTATYGARAGDGDGDGDTTGVGAVDQTRPAVSLREQRPKYMQSV